MSQTLSIKIRIADREYPMQAEAAMESKLRLAGKVLSDRLKKYTKHLGTYDKQDLLAMTAFDCIVELLDLQQSTQKYNELIANKISNLDDLASSVL